MGVGLTEDGKCHSGEQWASGRLESLSPSRSTCGLCTCWGGGQGKRGGPGLHKSVRSEVRDPRDDAEGFTP